MPELTKEQADALIPELYRDQARAVQCKHLRFTPLMRTTETLRPVPVVPRNGSLLLPHELPGPARIQLAPVTMWPQFPSLAFLCVSPKMLEWAHGLMPREVRSSVNDLETTLTACQCCAFWEERESQ